MSRIGPCLNSKCVRGQWQQPAASKSGKGFSLARQFESVFENVFQILYERRVKDRRPVDVGLFYGQRPAGYDANSLDHDPLAAAEQSGNGLAADLTQIGRPQERYVMQECAGLGVLRDDLVFITCGPPEQIFGEGQGRARRAERQAVEP